MNTQMTPESQPAQPITAPAPSAPAPSAPAPSAPAPSAPAPSAPAPSAPAPSAPPITPVDPMAGSSWPASAKDKVRDLARKNREKAEVISSKDAYIKHLEEKSNKAVHPQRGQFADGDAGDQAFVSAISMHNATLGGLAAEKERAGAELNTIKAEATKTYQELVVERVNAARTEFSDLDQVLQQSQLPVGQHLGYALQTADNGYQMMYILNKMHPSETARLNQLTWPEILQELPRLESKFRSSQTPSAPVTPAAPIVPPIEPIGGDSSFPSSGNGYKEWEADRNKNPSLRF